MNDEKMMIKKISVALRSILILEYSFIIEIYTQTHYTKIKHSIFCIGLLKNHMLLVGSDRMYNVLRFLLTFCSLLSN